MMRELWDITLGGLLEQMAERFPERQAVKYTDRPYYRSWRTFNEEVDRVAKGFMAMGITKGDHVAIWATNTPEWILTLFGAAKIGAVLVTVNTSYKVFELEYLLRQSDSKILVLMDGFKDSDYVKIINELCPRLGTTKPGVISNPLLPRLQQVVYSGQKATPAGMIAWDDILLAADEIDDEIFRTLTNSLSSDEVINMQYTSGTTGFPKGVMLTHKNIINNGRSIGDRMRFTEEDKLCITVPFFHCFGLVLAIMACLTHGTAMVPIDYFSPKPVMDALQNEGCTAIHGVPTMFIAILEHPEFKNHTFSKLRTGIMAGSPCPVKVMQQVVDEMGMKDITIVYGQTESSPGCTQTTTDDPIELRVSTVGRRYEDVETKLVDIETGLEVGPGVQGEFCARGYNVMKGYYKMPEATAQVIDKDGWLHTGDLATVDENGYYKITGRIKDMIIRGGENIYPKEIEEFLYTHDIISDVQVIGVPSIQYGEEVMACLVLKPGTELSEQDVKDYVKSHMARHKVPKYVAFMDKFPMTASGKIQKFKLREWAIEKYGLQAASAVETA